MLTDDEDAAFQASFELRPDHEEEYVAVRNHGDQIAPISLAQLRSSEHQAAKDLFTKESRLARRRLAAARINGRPGFSLSILGYGDFNRDSALKELESESKISDFLVEVEMRQVRRILSAAGFIQLQDSVI